MRTDGAGLVLDPRSIAVIGASSNPEKRGFQAVRTLQASGYSGRIYPVNPRGGEILGLEVVERIADLPDGVDLALVALPRASVPEAIREAGEARVGAAVVLAVGFGESGPEGQSLEEELRRACRETGIRVVGPNTSGVLNAAVGLNLAGFPGKVGGPLALLTQSGNVALALQTEAGQIPGPGIGMYVGVGNQADLTFSDYLGAVAADSRAKVAVIYAEGFRDARRFLAEADRLREALPILVLKGGRSTSGQAAAASHTGALSTPDDLFRAGLRQAGAIQLDRADELLFVARALSSGLLPGPGQGVAILSDGGGQGTLACDWLEGEDVTMATLSEETRAELSTLLGPAAATANPIDLAGAADRAPEVFSDALAILLADASVGSVLIVGLFGGYGIRFSETLVDAEVRAAERMATAAIDAGKPVLVHTMYAAAPSRPLEVLGEAGIAITDSLEVACRGLEAIVRRAGFVRAGMWDPEKRSSSRELVRAEGPSTGPWTEWEARELLEQCGVQFPTGARCEDAEAAARATSAIGGPVAMKVLSRQILHKADAGGVLLGVEQPDQAREAFGELVSAGELYLQQKDPSGVVEGVSVTRMLQRPLAELLIGVRRDERLGPVLTVGAGGIDVEADLDVAHRLLPVSDAEIESAIASLGISSTLMGTRGREKADWSGLVRAVRGVVGALESSVSIVEVEVNPLFVYADGCFAADALVSSKAP
jgi:acetyltransferase